METIQDTFTHPTEIISQSHFSFFLFSLESFLLKDMTPAAARPPVSLSILIPAHHGCLFPAVQEVPSVSLPGGIPHFLGSGPFLFLVDLCSVSEERLCRWRPGAGRAGGDFPRLRSALAFQRRFARAQPCRSFNLASPAWGRRPPRHRWADACLIAL